MLLAVKLFFDYESFILLPLKPNITLCGGDSMTKRMILLVLVLVTTSIQAMFYRTTPSRTVHKPVKSKTSVKYQKAVAAQKVLRQRVPAYQKGRPVGHNVELIQQKSERHTAQPSSAATQKSPVDLTKILYPIVTESHKQELTVHHKIVHDDKKG